MGSQTISSHAILKDDFEVRMMVKEDIEQVCAIENVSFTTPWSSFAFASELQDNELAFYLVIVSIAQPNHVVGYGGLWVVLDEAHVTNIAIDPAFRGNRLGEKLVLNMMAFARMKQANKITLEVRVSNRSAINLYQRLGFAGDAIRKRYYSDNNEDARIMWCDLRDDLLSGYSTDQGEGMSEK